MLKLGFRQYQYSAFTQYSLHLWTIHHIFVNSGPEAQRILRECRTPNKNSESTETHPFFPFSASPTHYELVMKLRNQSFFLTCLYPGPDESERFPTDHHSKGKES